ncbi:MAG: hypothetical protein GWP59_08805 [Chlamydiales bacterium]|nr:hypothetical protein [Chlamydiales bacterium]NCF71785.1 hypothetical protein [Chlamydiales bacterium]
MEISTIDSTVTTTIPSPSEEKDNSSHREVVELAANSFKQLASDHEEVSECMCDKKIDIRKPLEVEEPIEDRNEEETESVDEAQQL